MSTNKFATIRYQALDRCFSNKHREFTIWDLVQACNDAIYEYSGDDKYRVDAIRDHDDHEGVKKTSDIQRYKIYGERSRLEH